MKSITFLGASLLAGLGLSLVTGTSDVHAQNKKKDANVVPAVASDPPMTKKAIAVEPNGLTWGLSPSQVGDLVDKLLDEDYRPLYQAVQPGVKMKELDNQLAEDKATFRRSRIDFGKIPTGIDSTPLKGEYTYMNREALMSLNRKGETRYFFFIQERLWKAIDTHRLSDSSPFGKNYQDAVIKLVNGYGVAGRILPIDPTHPSQEVDWKDANTHLRAIQRSDTLLALAFEDNATVANLGTMRANKPVDETGIDPDVAAAMRKPEDQGGPPPGAGTGKKKKP